MQHSTSKQIKNKLNPKAQKKHNTKLTNLQDQQNQNILTVLQKYANLEQMKSMLPDHQFFLQQQNNPKSIDQQIKSQKNIRRQNLQQKYNISNTINDKQPQQIPYQYLVKQKDTYPIFYPLSFGDVNFQLERMRIDPKPQQVGAYLDEQFIKVNDQIEKVQKLINYSKHKDIIKQFVIKQRNQEQNVFSHIAYCLNNIVLLTNFIFSKLSYKQGQLIFNLQQSQQLYSQVRQQYLKLQTNHQILIQNVSKTKQSSLTIHNQLHRYRSVIQSYQLENHELRNELQTLRQVIDEMNMQIQAGQRKIQQKRKQCSILQQELQKISIYAKQLQMQVMEHTEMIGELRKLQRQVDRLECEQKKWRNRCFQQIKCDEQDTGGKKNKIIRNSKIKEQKWIKLKNIDQSQANQQNASKYPKNDLSINIL